MHNHIDKNYHLCNKKALFYNLKFYSNFLNQKICDFIPMTFHIENSLQDKEFKNFLEFYN
jgi:tubulin polyglutamylase TTLL1